MDVPEGTATHGKSLKKQKKRVKSEREKPLRSDHNILLSSLKGLRVTCHNSKRDKESETKSSMGKGKKRCLPYFLMFGCFGIFQ